MATVYVRWYGNILQGELLDGEYLGMKQVRIPLDGHHPVALFTPGHVYETIEAVPTCYPVKDPSVAILDMIKGHYEISQKESVAEFIEHTIDMQRVENFKYGNWDQEHKHLRIDKLDEFYRLWREAMRPFGFVEAEAVHESCTPSQQPKSHKPAAITKGYSEITSPYPAITQGYPEITQPYSKKTKKPQIVELSLFD